MMNLIKENIPVEIVFIFLSIMFLLTTSCNKKEETPLYGRLRILPADGPSSLGEIKNDFVSLKKLNSG